MKDDTYNGWANYETWLWKLWLDNDQSNQEYWAERVRDILNSDIEPQYDWETVDQLRRSLLASELEQDCDDSVSELEQTSGPFADILNAGISRIDWREIAESLLDDNFTNNYS